MALTPREKNPGTQPQKHKQKDDQKPSRGHSQVINMLDAITGGGV